MGVQRNLIIVIFALVAWYVAIKLNHTPPLPPVDPHPWWAPGDAREVNEAIRSFKINVSDEDMNDLKTRLSLSPRITPSMENTNFTYGVNSATLSVLLKYWTHNYDWRKREKRLNTFPHYKTRIFGLDVHFMRASPPKGHGKTVVPLLLIHGWPGSFVEFMDAIPLLMNSNVDRDFVLDVICPSLPGYGFSEASAKTGMNTLAMAQIFVSLMERLGYNKFYVQGGDWGSFIASDIATVYPERLFGVHLNMAPIATLGSFIKLFLGAFLPSGTIMDPEFENKWYPLSTYYGQLVREMGYMHLHATKPDTVGVALNSSPQGLAAYIFEKFSSWTDMENMYKKDGALLDPKFPISLDAILDNICIYWFTRSIETSIRLYAEGFHPDSPSLVLNQIPTHVPTGIAIFHNDLAIVPKNLATHKYRNIVTYNFIKKGGHFAAMEEPKLFADDVVKFVTEVERIRAEKSAKSSDLPI